ncbi:MAG: TetR/AcrR family transcriptional regulator [Bacillota bacterium]|nr:TetR/AcrR family transcriptional regulator [Bacillota bacterium]
MCKDETNNIDSGVHNKMERSIIEAAVRLFSQYGFTGTTTMAIAKEAGVSEKTLFKYFHTKQELYDKTVYPLLKTVIQEKVEDYAKKDGGGVYKLLHDLYLNKIRLTNENPDQLKLTIHEFLMNRSFQKQMAEIWTASYLPQLLSQLHFKEEALQKYGSRLTDGLTRIIVSTLIVYAIDKSYIRPEKSFDDETEIELMLELLFNGFNSLRKDGEEENA